MYYYFFKRELKDRFLGNITGFAWLFIQPVITLLIYWFVFDKIFHQRFSHEQQEVSFIVYLAIGFWPWLAFSESIIRAITSVSDKSDLIGKINIDIKIPVIASISATFFLHMIGYIVVLAGLVIFNKNFGYSSIPLVLIPLAQLFSLAVAIGLLLSAVQIFIRDTLQLMTTLMTLWFFLTPIIYPVTMLPEKYKLIIQLNPIYTPITFIHRALITHEQLPWTNMLILFVVSILLILFSVRIFNKLSPSFEDFK